MKFWKKLNFQEQMATFRSISSLEVDAKARTCFFAAAKLVKDDEAASRMLWNIQVNDFLINTPEEVAAYCRELAAIERRNARFSEALAICRQKLDAQSEKGCDAHG